MQKLCPFCGAKLKRSMCNNSLCGGSRSQTGRYQDGGEAPRDASITRTLIAVTAFYSIGFLSWFAVVESDTPGLSFSIAFIAATTATAIYTWSTSTSTSVSRDGKGAAIASVVVAAIGLYYHSLFFQPWIPISLGWVGMQVVSTIAVLAFPTDKSAQNSENTNSRAIGMMFHGMLAGAALSAIGSLTSPAIMENPQAIAIIAPCGGFLGSLLGFIVHLRTRPRGESKNRGQRNGLGASAKGGDVQSPHNTRPLSITVIGYLYLFSSFASLLGFATHYSDDRMQDFISQSSVPSSILLTFALSGLLVMVIFAYAILSGKNWGRWLYLIWNTFAGFIATATSPAPLMTAIGVVPVLLVSYLLFRPRANKFFASGA